MSKASQSANGANIKFLSDHELMTESLIPFATHMIFESFRNKIFRESWSNSQRTIEVAIFDLNNPEYEPMWDAGIGQEPIFESYNRETELLYKLTIEVPGEIIGSWDLYPLYFKQPKAQSNGSQLASLIITFLRKLFDIGLKPIFVFSTCSKMVDAAYECLGVGLNQHNRIHHIDSKSVGFGYNIMRELLLYNMEL